MILNLTKRLQEGTAFGWNQGYHFVGMPSDAIRAFATDRAFTRGGRGGRARGFDAAGSSGMAFLQSQLELINPRLVEPLQSVTHERDFPMKYGGGYPEQLVAWATDYTSSGSGSLGIQGTNNTDIPISTANMNKAIWPTYIWSQGFNISWADLKRMEFARANGNQPPFSLQSLYEKSVRTTWLKVLDMNGYLGILGQPGLVNNTNVLAMVVPNGAASSTLWVNKTGTEILNDINTGINLTVQNSGYDIASGCADTMLIPYPQFAQLTKPITIGGVGYDSVLSYIRRNCVAAQYFNDEKRFNIFPLPNPFISGQGIGNTAAQNAPGNGADRAVFYRNQEEDIEYRIPTAMMPTMTVPTERGPGYSTYFGGNIGAVQVYRSTTMAYLDGI